MSRKCTECNGCTKDIWIGNTHYFYCDFCYIIYKHTEEGFERLTEEELVELVKISGIRIDG